jgi:hypothetical protein
MPRQSRYLPAGEAPALPVGVKRPPVECWCVQAKSGVSDGGFMGL